MMQKKENTKLKQLALAIASSDIKIFPNQTVMYQALVALVANQNNLLERQLLNIKEYVKCVWKNENTEGFDNLHIEMIHFLTQDYRDINIKELKIIDNRDLHLSDSLKSTVSYIMTGKRKAMPEWKDEYNRYSDNSNIFVYRIFWILQYFYAKYCSADVTRRNDFFDKDTEYTEYYQLNAYVANSIFWKLKKHCNGCSNLLDEMEDMVGDTRVLARIIFEIIYKHYEGEEFDDMLSKLEYKEETPYMNDIAHMRKEYDSNVDIYDRTTMDWFHVCEKYSQSNSIAATELGNLYFSGATFKAGEIFSFKIEPDYKKASELFQKAIYMSEKPYAPACWNMGHMLAEKYTLPENIKYDINKKALEYFDMAEDYAPAYNSKAKMILKDTDEKYTAGEINYKKAIQCYAEGLTWAYKASELNWLYGNNIIANFIIDKRNREDAKQFFLDLDEQTGFPYGLSAIYFLERSAKYKNPWALYMLAEEYIAHGEMDKAEDNLLLAKELNFYLAYCPLAIHFYRGEEQKRLLRKASEEGCALATYEYAVRFSSDLKEERRYLNQALNQLYALRVMDGITLKKVCERMEYLNQKQSA